METALHLGQRQALSRADEPGGGRDVPHPLGDPGTAVWASRTKRWRRCCFSTATYCVSIGITCSTKSLAFTILSSGVTVHNRTLTTPTTRNEKTAQCAAFSSDHLPTDQGRRASASTSLALGSRSCLVTANGPILSIGTATMTEEITTITAPIMCVSARPSIDSPP